MYSKDFKEFGAKYIDEKGTFQYSVYARIRDKNIILSISDPKNRTIEYIMTPELFGKFYITIMSLIGHLSNERHYLTDILDKQRMTHRE